MQTTDQDPHLSHDPTKSFVAKVIDWSVHNQLLVGMMMIALLVAGILAVQKTPLDAIPDMSDTQVIIRTDFVGQSPQIVEDLVTYPLSTTMLGLPKTKNVRGFSMFGTSFVYIIFEDKIDQYWARSRVIEALSKIQGDLPPNVVPQIGPDATGVGWVYQYALVDKTGKHDLAYLRTLQDWFLKFELATVEGVSEVASVGGFVKEYQVLVDPNRLRAYDVPLHRIAAAVKAASKEVGGRVLEKGEMELIIRSKGYITNLEELKQVVVYAKSGTPVLLSDVARIIEGPELRRGVVDQNWGNDLGDLPRRFVAIGNDAAVAVEEPRIVDHDWRLADLAHIIQRFGDRTRTGLLALDDLNQQHLFNGAEEMDADELFWPL
mgnify:CR=1 FL=1